MGHNFTVIDIERVINELVLLVKGARIQDVFQTSRNDLYIEIYRGEGSRYLLISIENGFNRIYCTYKRESSPSEPFSFQMLLRKYLTGEFIENIEQINKDRVIRISTSEFNVYAELTGRHANIFLTDITNIILGSIRENVSQKRALFVSRKYIPPFPHQFDDVGGLLIPEISSASEFYSEYYSRIIYDYRLLEKKRDILKSLNRKKAHYYSILNKIGIDRTNALKYEQYLKYAEAIKQNVVLEKKRDSVIFEYYTEKGKETIEVPIDCRYSLFENMEKYYRNYKRLKNSLKIIDEREEYIKKRLQEIEGRINQVVNCQSLENLSSFEDRDKRKGTGNTQTMSGGRERLPFAVFYVEGVGKIYSGTDATSNEILTFKFARGNDLWFHVVGYSGSHTVLPVERNKVPSERQILTAAMIAAARSSAPEDESVEVAYTRVKYIRKVKGGEKGSVFFSKEKRIRVRVDKDYINRVIKIS